MKDILAYIASPMGFSEAGRYFYYEKFLPVVVKAGYVILDPWRLTPPEIVDVALKLPCGPRKKKTWQEINRIIGRNNEFAIRKCHVIMPILDGVDVDSGTAAEIGLAYGWGKKIIGYRGDFRLSGDNEGSLINLQVEYFIERSGGRIAASLKEFNEQISRLYAQLSEK